MHKWNLTLIILLPSQNLQNLRFPQSIRVHPLQIQDYFWKSLSKQTISQKVTSKMISLNKKKQNAKLLTKPLKIQTCFSNVLKILIHRMTIWLPTYTMWKSKETQIYYLSVMARTAKLYRKYLHLASLEQSKIFLNLWSLSHFPTSEWNSD